MLMNYLRQCSFMNHGSSLHYQATRLPFSKHDLPELKEIERGSSPHASFVNAIIIAFDLMRAF